MDDAVSEVVLTEECLSTAAVDPELAAEVLSEDALAGGEVSENLTVVAVLGDGQSEMQQHWVVSQWYNAFTEEYFRDIGGNSRLGYQSGESYEKGFFTKGTKLAVAMVKFEIVALWRIIERNKIPRVASYLTNLEMSRERGGTKGYYDSNGRGPYNDNPNAEKETRDGPSGINIPELRDIEIGEYAHIFVHDAPRLAPPFGEGYTWRLAGDWRTRWSHAGAKWEHAYHIEFTFPDTDPGSGGGSLTHLYGPTPY